LRQVNSATGIFATFDAGAHRVGTSANGEKVMTGIYFSCAEVTSLSPNGFWLQCGEEELYLPFVEFPLFEHATIAQICRVEFVSRNRLYWPELDLDLTLEAIRNPMAFPHDSINYDC
jgi:hypothetical protein